MKPILLAGFIAMVMYVSCSPDNTADIILYNAEVYTMESEQPWAETIVIKDNKIIDVLAAGQPFQKYVSEQTKLIDLKRKFIMPGYIDAHTHFDDYCALQLDADLMPVSDAIEFVEEIKRVVSVLPKGEWITGGAWDGHRLWNANWEDREKLKKNRWKPNKELIDSLTSDYPCFLNSWDKDLYLANSKALSIAELIDAPIKGMELKDGKPTGLIYKNSPAINIIREIIKPKSEERKLLEIKAGLKALAESGITEIHDITPEGYPELFAKIDNEDGLTSRIWMRLDLSRSKEIADKNIKMNTHPATGKRNYKLRYGGYKGYMDGLMGSHGALLYDPYTDKPDTYGHYRSQSSDDSVGYKNPNINKIYNFMDIAYGSGFIVNTHAIGDKGVSLVLDQYEKLAEKYGKDKIERSRVIHAQTIIEDDYIRFSELGIIAEVTPSNIEDDMRWIIRRLGSEREKRSHPYKKFIANNVKINGGSDIPGAQGATFNNHPASMINAVVNRTKNDGTPDDGWLPEHKLTMHEAIKMYTIDAAYAVFDENVRGSIKIGKQADLTICDMNLMKANPKDVLKMNIEMTIVDGKIVYQKN